LFGHWQLASLATRWTSGAALADTDTATIQAGMAIGENASIAGL
jgi:hypothetical protein